MTIKELFKLLEKTNELHRFFNEPELCLQFSINDYWGSNKEFDNYKQFVKYVKSEWVDWFVEKVLSIELNEDAKCYHKTAFETQGYFGTVEHNTIEVYLVEKRRY